MKKKPIKKAPKTSAAYRNAKGQWTKASAKDAIYYGIREGRKITKISPKDLNVDVIRDKDNIPRYKYRSRGKFISKAAGEALQATQEFKTFEREKITHLNRRREMADEVGESVPFFNLNREFQKVFVDIFGFNSLTIFKGNEILRYTNLAKANLALAFEGYRATKIAEKANLNKSPTPEALFNIPIKMLEDGEYYIDINF